MKGEKERRGQEGGGRGGTTVEHTLDVSEKISEYSANDDDDNQLNNEQSKGIPVKRIASICDSHKFLSYL